MSVKILYPTQTGFKPTNIAVSAARTCYYPNGLVEPEQSESWKSKPQLLASIFEAGHHTTLQHAHFTLLIDNMSRHLIWRLLHAHPYYNSEQVSQRYAKMKAENFVYPVVGDANAWQKYYATLFSYYERLSAQLAVYFEKTLPKFKRKDSVKKAQEFARYVLPQGTGAYLYHTVNLTVLLRYIAAAKTLPECKDEAITFADEIAEGLCAIDENLRPLVRRAQEMQTPFPDFSIEVIKKEKNIGERDVSVFDVVHAPCAYSVDERYSDVLRLSMLEHDAATLGSFNTCMTLSLSADAQNQRHRRSVSVHPSLEQTYTKRFYLPPCIQENAEIAALYSEAMEYAYGFFEKQAAQIGFSEAVYALPNAHMITIVEHNDMASFHHKAQMRLCFNAQQEIYDIVYEQIKQLRAHNIQHADMLMPPCVLRNKHGIFPTCPEGVRFCGTKVWKEDFETFYRAY